MGNIRLLVTHSHGPNEALILDWPSSEIWPDERRLGNHPLPPLLLRLRTSLDDLEHLILSDSFHSWQRHRKLRRLLLSLLLDRRTERLGGIRPLAVEQVGGQRLRRGLGGLGGLDRLLLVRLEGLSQLDLLGVPLLGVEFRPQTVQFLCIFRLLVRFTRGLLSLALLVVETGREGGG